MSLCRPALVNHFEDAPCILDCISDCTLPRRAWPVAESKPAILLTLLST